MKRAMKLLAWGLSALVGVCGLDPAEPKAAVDYLDRTIAPPESGRVPSPLRQGEFLSPQSVSALAIRPEQEILVKGKGRPGGSGKVCLLARDPESSGGRALEFSPLTTESASGRSNAINEGDNGGAPRIGTRRMIMMHIAGRGTS